MHLVKGSKFGLGFCAIGLVMACGSKERSFGNPGKGDGGSEPASSESEGTQSNSTASESADDESTQTSTDAGAAPPGASDGDAALLPDAGDTTDASTPVTSDADSGALDTGSLDTGSLDTGDGAVPNDCGNVDPDCECVEGVLQGRDEDEDSHRTMACEAAPGDDCDDGDAAFVANVCGGCSRDLVGAPGDACLECGVLSCTGPDVLSCVAPNPAPLRCATSVQVEVCWDGVWASYGSCSVDYYCAAGQCYSVPSASSSPSSTISSASSTSSALSSTAYAPQTAPDRCNTPDAQCVYGSFHPRDASFEIAPTLIERVRGAAGKPTHAVLDSIIGLDLG